MWVFTRYGFYSIACASKSNGSLDSQSVMVRARCIAHLRTLQTRFPALAVGKILELPNHDYRYRLVIPKASWTAIIGELAQEQEWSNFKNETAKYQGKSGREYVRALHEVWAVMHRLQEGEERENKQDNRASCHHVEHPLGNIGLKSEALFRWQALKLRRPRRHHAIYRCHRAVLCHCESSRWDSKLYAIS